MKKSSILLVLLAILLSFGGCASKRYAKKAKKFEEAGLYEDAANMYYESAKKDNENIDAKLGLRKNGQLLLDKKLAAFSEAYKTGRTKDAVYAYIDADNYNKKIVAVGVSLTFPEHQKEYYKEVKETYLYDRYNEGVKALDLEDFANAFLVFDEIVKIDASYKDSKSNYVIAKYEPQYRDGINKLDNGLFRSAYYIFEKIVKEQGEYKDVLTLKDEALEKATITIAIVPFNTGSNVPYEMKDQMTAEIIREINHLDMPFYKIINNEQVRQKVRAKSFKIFFDKTTKESSIAAGNSLGVKAILTGKVIAYRASEGKLSKQEKRGYIKNIIQKKSSTGEAVQEVKYSKVTYLEYKKTNNVSLRFQYKLVSTETGEILATNYLNLDRKDEVHYAVYGGGNAKKLIPGYWKHKTRNSAQDKKEEGPMAVNKLQRLLKANKTIVSSAQLTNNLINEIAEQVAEDIKNYNPEK